MLAAILCEEVTQKRSPSYNQTHIHSKLHILLVLASTSKLKGFLWVQIW